MQKPLSWHKLDALEAACDSQEARIIHETWNGTFNIRVYESADYRWLAFNERMQSGALLSRPHDLLFNYTRTMLAHRIFCEPITSALLLGLGGGSLVRFLARHQPQLRITAVDNSAIVFELAQDYFGLPEESPLFTFTHADGRDYLRATDAQHDVILLDMFDQRASPSWLDADDLYQACRARLTGRGVLVVNLLVPDTTQLQPLLAPLRRAFETRVLYAARDPYNNVVAFAFNETPLDCGDALLVQLAASLEQKLRLPYMAWLRHFKTQQAALRSPLS
jgi:spermidine synthase